MAARAAALRLPPPPAGAAALSQLQQAALVQTEGQAMAATADADLAEEEAAELPVDPGPSSSSSRPYGSTPPRPSFSSTSLGFVHGVSKITQESVTVRLRCDPNSLPRSKNGRLSVTHAETSVHL